MFDNFPSKFIEFLNFPWDNIFAIIFMAYVALRTLFKFGIKHFDHILTKTDRFLPITVKIIAVCIFGFIILNMFIPNLKFKSEAKDFDYTIETIAIHLKRIESGERGYPLVVQDTINDTKITLDNYKIPYPEFSKKEDLISWICYLSQISDLAKRARLKEARSLGRCIVENLDEVPETKPPLVPKLVY